MNHFKHIEIKKFRGIKKLKLAELGRINILCGKNNSGKSTILNSILEKHSQYGIVLKELDKENIYESLDEKLYEWEYFDDKKVLIPFIAGDYEMGLIYNSIKEKEILEQYTKTNEILLSDNYSDFEEKIISIVIKNKIDLEGIEIHDVDFDFGEPIYRDDIFKILYNKIIEFHGKPIMVDAKRKLDSYISLTEFKKKKHLLKYLFYLKNSQSNSEKILLQKLKEVFKEITSGFQFLIISDQEFKLTLNFVNNNGERYSADQCGLGLRDLLLILSRIILADINHILLIEEPENHLHPDIQRRLLDYISRKTKNQFFITTHSNVFLDTKYVDKIFHVKYNKSNISVEEMNSKANLLSDLGYSISDNLIADLIILVEGPSDKMIIEEFFVKYGIYAKYNLRIWALGGGIMNRHDLSIFSDTYKVLALIDNDPEEDREEFESNCQNLGVEIFKLERYSIENYFTIEALKIVFKNRIIASDDFKINENIKISKQSIGDFNPKRGGIPRRLAKAMKLEDIYGTDLERFFKLVIEKLENNV